MSRPTRASTSTIAPIATTVSPGAIDPAVLQQIIEAVQAAVEKSIDNRLELILSGLSQRTDKLENELEVCKAENVKLRNQIEDLSSYTRRDDLIFHGLKVSTYAGAAATVAQDSTTVPSMPVNASNSDAELAVLECCRKQLSVEISLSDISVAHRLGGRRSGGGQSRNGSHDNPIIVRFCTRRARDSVFAARKQLKGTRIFINEHLTTSSAELYKLARSCAKDKRIHSTWTFNGNVFIKESEQGRPIKITSKDNLPV